VGASFNAAYIVVCFTAFAAPNEVADEFEARCTGCWSGARRILIATILAKLNGLLTLRFGFVKAQPSEGRQFGDFRLPLVLGYDVNQRN